MLASNFLDKEKNIPVGPAIVIDGMAVRRQRNMIYWYRWGRHTFDIRVMREVLGLPEKHPSDNYYMPGNEFSGDGDRALAVNISAIAVALGDRPFKSVMKQHDAIIRNR